MIANAASNPAEAVRRFEREAQAAGRIGSDHILEVLDLGTLPNGDRYMVMEFLDGETLAERISRHGHLTPRQVAPLARQFLAALASAHAAGIIHRDLKPENIFILRSKAGRSDFVKLIDFGVSKFANLNDGHRTTRAGSVLGTPCYMSPEQARGRGEADIRSDIYACGVILYECVTGKLPFHGETFNDLMFKIALSEAPSPLALVPALDPEFAWIIERAMARDPGARFQTVQEFSEKLDDWMRRNELTGTLAQPLPAEAFPLRERSPSSHDAPTLEQPLDREIENLELQETGIVDSWASSQQKTFPLRRNVALLGFAILAAAGAVLLAAVALRPATSAAEIRTPVQASAPAPPRPEPEPIPEPAAAPPVAAVPSAAAPAPSSVAAAPPPRTSPGAAARPRPAPKPPASTTRKPLDFGY
jgi:serine/threonine-protein kinase